ncbi:MAG: hypothetical protein H6934_13155 [Burkholderiaceae bacterium]|nr:hypothetical protein [Burkholderiaceae bacterium]
MTSHRSPARNRHRLRVATSVLVGLASTAWLIGASPAVAEPLRAYRCDLADGRVVFGDSPCAGARSRRWQPSQPRPGIAKGSQGSGVVQGSAPAVAAGSPGDRVRWGDPYLDCRSQGGRFDLVSRVCRVSSQRIQVLSARHDARH